MKIRAQSSHKSSEHGFTLLEVMVALIVGTLVVGGVMGLISSSLQYTQRLKEKSQIQPLLEAAAQEIIANPEKVLEGSLQMAAFPNSPPVQVFSREETGADGGFGERQAAGPLYRVMLNCMGQALEFSVIIPQSTLEDRGLR